MEKFSVIIVSPGQVLYEGTADEVVVPGGEGTMSILARHAPLLVSLKRGTVEIVSGSSEREFDIESGFVEVSKKTSTQPKADSPQAEETGEQNSFVNIFVRQA